MACRISWLKLHFTWNDCGECATITCALRWEVAFVELIFIECGSPFMGKAFQVQDNTGGRCSSEAAIVKNADMWP